MISAGERALSLAVHYFDGITARAIDAALDIEGDFLVVRESTSGDALARLALRGLQWPERTVAPTRILSLPKGEIHAIDAVAWDRWVSREVRANESLIVRIQQNWCWAFGALALLIGSLAVGYAWGIPWASRALVSALPTSVDVQLGEVALPQIDKLLLKPSALPTIEQRAWQRRFTDMLMKANLDPRSATLRFRASRIGPNAFALPGGVIVVTDELIDLAHQEQGLIDAIVLGVLAHEYGHVLHRHSVKHLVSTSLLSMVSGVLWGDYSGALALVPLLVGQAGYSRDAEREADAAAVRILHAAGISPLGMVRFFAAVDDYLRAEAVQECIAKKTKDAASNRKITEKEARVTCEELPFEASEPLLGIAIASHPSDRERIEFFARAARRQSE